MAKKYKLRCFNCGELFNEKTEVHRVMGMPNCEACWVEYHTGIAELDAYDYEMKKWHESHPNQDYEQWQIDQANIRKYGEF
ncbi:Zn finger protein [Lokiarchaeota virus WyrdV1]|nr:Zn finger protein [Lokiarchaeota virus WyrdV1]